MDIKIWEKTLLAWFNLLSSSPVDSISEINDCLLVDIIKKINSNCECDFIELLKEIFPNLIKDDILKLSSSVDYLSALTLLLIYVSLSKKKELEDVKSLMCTKLDNVAQLNIVQFLMGFQEYENVLNFSFQKLKQEIFPQIFMNFKENYCKNKLVMNDFSKTPIKNDSPNLSFDSPLQGFFQTPKRNKIQKRCYLYNMCGDGDYLKHIKKLTDQLAEEELEKASLQEQLNIQNQKCNEYEARLKNKIEEINHLKEEWENESKKNEEEVITLKNSIVSKLEYEKRLKNDLSNLESYVATLESDVSKCMTKNDRLESQLQEVLENFTASELQVKEATELCFKLQSAVDEKEKELEQFKENYANFFCDEKTIDVSFINKSHDKSIGSPESMEIVVDKLLREKIEENNSLQETIEELRVEKNSLIDELKTLNEQLAQKCSVISELQFLKKELNTKVETFEETEKELFKVKKDLLRANEEISKLNRVNSHLTEKHDILSKKLQEREQVLLNCKNSKALLQINFLKLAEDFRAVQQRLEFEVNNISRLALGKPCAETDRTTNEISEIELKKCIHQKSSKNIQVEQKNEEIASYSFPIFSDEKICKLTELLQHFENQIEWSESKASLQTTCSQLNDNIIVLKTKIHELQENHKNSLDKKLKLEKHLKEAEEKLSGIQSDNFSQIKKLNEELEKKENKVKELENLIAQKKKMHNPLHFEFDNAQKKAKVFLNKRKAESIPESGDHKRTSDTVSNNISPEMGTLEILCERQEFSDSLEEVPVPNKTFDIVNLEDKHIVDKTFSIKKEYSESFSKSVKSDSAWIISPPSKVPVKIPSKEGIRNQDNRHGQSETWTVFDFDSKKSKDNKMKKVSSSVSDLRMKTEEIRVFELQKEIKGLSKECDRLRSALLEVEQKRKKDKEGLEKNQEIIRQNITAKYESQLEHLKNEMKQLYNRELSKHKQEQSTVSSELKDQNKRYKEHIDELRNQLWDLREKLLQEQTLKRDLERNYSELKEKYENLMFSKEPELKNLHISDIPQAAALENTRISTFRQLPSVTFPTIPTEDEDEVFDNRFLEDMKTGVCKMEKPEDRLRELQYRNSLCLPHLKSSYPGETQFHNPIMFKETDLKFGLLQFAQESQSLTDSDHSMTKSLIPDNKGKKKDQPSYKRPGPPTPSKNGGRLSFQGSDIRLTPRNVLKEINDQNERNRGTPNPLKLLLSSRNIKAGSMGVKDENTAPVTPRKKKFFRKPFGARDH